MRDNQVERVGQWEPPIPTDENTLTVQELQAAYLADYDLGPGYPHIEVPTYIRNLYMDDSIEDLSLRFAPFWSPDKQAQVDVDLESAVRRFLRIPDTTVSIRPTFSGTLALDRALAAARRLASRAGYDDMTVVATTPSIDIMRLLFEDNRVIAPQFVPSRAGGVLGALDVEKVRDALLSTNDRHLFPVLMVTSPENPTGSTWSRDDLAELARACGSIGGFMIVDHCFAVAGVHDAALLPRIWDVPEVPCDWAAIWDTGKTFGLNEDKLGFIVCGSAESQNAVDAACAVMQFGVSRRQKMFFAELLRRSFFYGYVAELTDVCRANVRTASALLGDRLPVRPISAGSLLLIDIAPLQCTDEEARARLLDAAIGVVAGRVFFHTEWCPEHFLRVALARQPDYFAAAMERLLEVVT